MAGSRPPIVSTAFPSTYLIDANGQAIGMKSGPRIGRRVKSSMFFASSSAEGGGSGSVGGSMELEPAAPLPKMLRAKGHGVLVHGQQDAQSEVIGKLAAATT